MRNLCRFVSMTIENGFVVLLGSDKRFSYVVEKGCNPQGI